MTSVHLITGGQRSGKSSLAQEIALQNSKNPIYLATARVWDDDFKKRIERHKSDRGAEWKNIEEEKFISSIDFAEKSVVVIDCITLWLTNFFTDNKFDLDTTFEQAKSEWDKLLAKNINIIVVSNEIGMGIHADTAVGRKFTDLQGWMNQYIASKANKVSFMVSGIEMKIK